MTTVGDNMRTGPRVGMSRIGMIGGAKAGQRPAAESGVHAWNKSWMALAKCRDLDPALFFPSDGGGVRVAQQICALCPMKIPCLRYAIGNRIDEGVWGGTSERERRRIVKHSNAAPGLANANTRRNHPG